MIEYIENGNVAICDGRKFKRDLRTGYFLSANKTDIGRRERLHRYVYRHYVGEIPAGYHVHHINEDKNDNEPENLMAMSCNDHEKLHGKTMTEERKETARNIINEKARPKAIEWHRSEAGREWHRIHGREVAAKMKPKPFVCEYCGKEFESKNTGNNRFCSNNCKSHARRNSGVDDVTKICEVCGKEYIANKYTNTRYCSGECRKKNAGKPYTVNGETHNLREWAKITGVPANVASDRMCVLGWDPERAITEPVKHKYGKRRNAA